MLILQGLKSPNIIIQGFVASGEVAEDVTYIPASPYVGVTMFEKGHRVAYVRWPAFQRFCIPVSDKKVEDLYENPGVLADDVNATASNTYWVCNQIDVIAQGLYLYGKDFVSDDDSTMPQYIPAAAFIENNLNTIICRPFEVPHEWSQYLTEPETVNDLYEIDSDNLDDEALDENIDTEYDAEIDAETSVQRASLNTISEPVDITYNSMYPMGPNPFFVVRLWRQAPTKDDTQEAEERDNAYGSQIIWGWTATDGWQLSLPIGGDPQLYRWIKDPVTSIYTWVALPWTHGSLSVSSGSMDKDPIRLYFGVIDGAICIGTNNFPSNDFAWYRPTNTQIMLQAAPVLVHNNTGQCMFAIHPMKMFDVTLKQVFYTGISRCAFDTDVVSDIQDYSTMCNPYAYDIVESGEYLNNIPLYCYPNTGSTRKYDSFTNSDIIVDPYVYTWPAPGKTHFHTQYSAVNVNEDGSVSSNPYQGNSDYIEQDCMSIVIQLKPLGFDADYAINGFLPGWTSPGVKALSLYARVDETLTTLEQMPIARIATNVGGESHVIEIEVDAPEESGVQTARMILDNKNSDYAPAIGSPTWEEVGDMRLVRLTTPGWWWKKSGTGEDVFTQTATVWTEFFTAEADWSYPTVTVNLVDILGPASLIKNIGQFPPGGGWNVAAYLRELFESNFYPSDALTFEDTGTIIPFGDDATKPQWLPERGRTLLEFTRELLDKVTPGAAIWSAGGHIYTGCKYCAAQRTAANWRAHQDNGYRSTACGKTLGLLLYGRPAAGVLPHTVLMDATVSSESITDTNTGNIIDIQGADIYGRPLRSLVVDRAAFTSGSLFYTGWPIMYSEESDELTTPQQVTQRALNLLTAAGGSIIDPASASYKPSKAYYLSGTVLENFLINRGLLLGINAGDCPDRSLGGNAFRVVACNHGVTRRGEPLTKFRARWVGPHDGTEVI